MKRYLPVFVIILFCTTASYSQIMVGNSTFPKVGDVLRTFNVTENPDQFSAGSAGENLLWDFSQLAGGDPEVQNFLEKTTGSNHELFPDANLLIKFEDDETETYARATTNRIEIVGFTGPNPAFGGELNIAYNKRPQIRRSPMFYETTSRSEGEFRVELSANIIPDTLLAGLPIRPDSIRFQSTSISNDTIDAWGKLSLANKTYDVLREKAYSISEFKIFVKLPFLGWIDLAALGAGIPGGVGDVLGADTTITYNFYTNTIKETLVSVETDIRGNVFGITYANTGTVNTEDSKLLTTFDIFPNPVKNDLFIDMKGNLSGVYRFDLINLAGQVVHSKNLSTNENEIIHLTIPVLSPGLYMLNVINATGQKVQSNKLVLE